MLYCLFAALSITFFPIEVDHNINRQHKELRGKIFRILLRLHNLFLSQVPHFAAELQLSGHHREQRAPEESF